MHMKFVLSFSGGKDSILALHKMISTGHEPAALLVMFREDAKRSWVHGMDMETITAIGNALKLPVICCHAGMDTYAEDMEKGLLQAKELGAEACVFGDIDIEEHRTWDEARCTAAGMQAVLPLWGCSRETNVREAVNLGYRCIIKCVRNGVLPVSMLGKPLTPELLDEMESYGIDLCGENGEYHTIVTDGPVFSHPVKLLNRGNVKLEYVTAADLVPISVPFPQNEIKI